MPISGDQFEALGEGDTEPSPGTNADRILSFLETNPDQAFTQTEIVEATDIKRGSVGPTLVRLREDGRVDHKGNYWRVSDHLRSVDASTLHATAVAARTEDESMSYEEWEDYAVDPRENRE